MSGPASLAGQRLRLARKTPPVQAPFYAMASQASGEEVCEGADGLSDAPRVVMPFLDSDDDWQDDIKDEGEVDVSGRLLAALQNEVASEIASAVSAVSGSPPARHATITCPLCPFLRFRTEA